MHHGADVEPSEVFEEGFPMRGRNIDLINHGYERGDTAYRGTTIEIIIGKRGGAGGFAGDGGWVYVIDDTKYWDINSALEGRVKMPDGSFRGAPIGSERERAILASVPRERIRGAYPIFERNGRLLHGELMPNPNYRPLLTTGDK